MLARLLPKLRSVRLLVVGDLVADHYLIGQTERVSREAPVLVVRHRSDIVKLGGAANVAANARALGARVTATGLLGHDPMGRAVRRLCAEQQIELRTAGGRGVETETKTRVLAGGFGTTLQQMLRIDRGAAGTPAQRVRRSLAAQLRRLLRQVDAVVVSDYGAGAVCAETLEVLGAAMAAGVPVCVDSRFGLRRFRGARVCKPNEPELAALTGMPVDTDDDVLAAGRAAQELLACEVLLVTRGQRGMAVFHQARAPVLVPPWGPKEAVDVTGAGDTVLATFALAYSAGGSPTEAARLASVAGGIVVQRQGTASVTPAELKEALAS